jgi:hypothetical protein
MMRRPSPIMRLLKWHRASMRGDNPPRHDADPHCGWYRMRMVKNGPWVPVEIWCDRDVDEHGELTRDEVLRADAFGEELDPAKIWTYLRPISKAEFEQLTEYRMKNQHLIDNKRPIDLGTTPTPPRG